MNERPSYRQTFFRLLGFLKPYKWSLIVSIVLSIGSQAAAVVIAFLTGDGLQEAATGGSREAIWWIALGILAAGLVRALLMMGRRLISGRQALAVEFDMRNALYAKLQRLSFGFYDRHQTGQLMSRATVDLQAVRFFLGYGLIFFFQHITTVVGVTAVMYVANWRLALAATAITPLIVIVAYRYSTVSHPILREVQQKMADVATVAEEGIVGVHVVKSFAQEGSEGRKFAGRSEAVFEQSVKVNRQRALYVPLLSFLPLVAQAIVLLVGGRMVVNGNLTLGSFIFFNVLVVMLVQPLRMLGMWIGQSQRATASGERIFEVMDEPEEVTDLPDAVELAARRRACSLRARLVRLRPRAPGAARHRPRARARPHSRADRPHGLRQDDARDPGSEVLRHRRRQGDHRRSRRARGQARLPAAADRDRRAGSVPLLGHGAREHRVRPAGRLPGGGRGGRATRAGARLRRLRCRRDTTR